MTEKRLPKLELLNQLEKLNDERKIDEKFCEDYKNKIAKELKSIDPIIIKNTVTVEKKTNLWQRILRTLGMN
jgi:hypothetical protein